MENTELYTEALHTSCSATVEFKLKNKEIKYCQLQALWEHRGGTGLYLGEESREIEELS